jgi:hypothetical protein
VGDSGKTRLALALGRDLAGRFPGAGAVDAIHDDRPSVTTEAASDRAAEVATRSCDHSSAVPRRRIRSRSPRPEEASMSRTSVRPVRGAD